MQLGTHSNERSELSRHAMTDTKLNPVQHARIAIYSRYALLSFILLTTSVLALVAR